MAIAGGSYGGYMTNWALARSDRFRAGVSLFGIYSRATAQVRHSYHRLGHLEEARWLNRNTVPIFPLYR